MNSTPQFSGGWLPASLPANALGVKVAMPASTAAAGAVGQFAMDSDKLAVYVDGTGWIFYTGWVSPIGAREILTAQLLAANKTSLTTATPKNITSLSLTAGDWEVSGVVGFVPANTTTVVSLIGYSNHTVPYTSSGLTHCVSLIPTQINVAVTTTIYLVANANFGVSTCTAYGTLRARRIR
jgi:hypothetical protein